MGYQEHIEVDPRQVTPHVNLAMATLGVLEFRSHPDIMSRLVVTAQDQAEIEGYPTQLELCVSSYAEDELLVEAALKDMRVQVIDSRNLSSDETAKIITYLVIGYVFDLMKNCWVVMLHRVPR